MNWPDRFAASRIWPWNRLYELKNLSPYQREAIWGECFRSRGLAPQGCLLLVLWVVLCAIAWVIVATYFRHNDEKVPHGIRLLFYVLFGVIGGLGANAVLRRTQTDIRTRIMEAYQDRRLPHCLHCGYALDGLPDDQANYPECGESVRGADAIPQSPR